MKAIWRLEGRPVDLSLFPGQLDMLRAWRQWQTPSNDDDTSSDTVVETDETRNRQWNYRTL